MPAVVDASTTTNGNSRPALTPDVYQALMNTIKGSVYPRGTTNFTTQTRLWNGNIVCPAKVVVCPVDAEDVSCVVKLCNKYKLSLSVKAGGYAVAGWAAAGDVVVDLCLLADIDIEPPRSYFSDGQFEWTPLQDMPRRLAGSTVGTTVKGKGRALDNMDVDGARPSDAADAADSISRAAYMLPRADSTAGVGGKRARSPSPTLSNGASTVTPARSVEMADGSPKSPISDRRPTKKTSPATDVTRDIHAQTRLRVQAQDAATRMSYDDASAATAALFRGPPLPPDSKYTDDARKPPSIVTEPSSKESPEDRDPFAYLNGPTSSSARTTGVAAVSSDAWMNAIFARGGMAPLTGTPSAFMDGRSLESSRLSKRIKATELPDGTKGQGAPKLLDGADSVDGEDGIDGVNGIDGADGVDGVDSADGTVDGIDGVDGTDGVDGIDGSPRSPKSPSPPGKKMDGDDCKDDTCSDNSSSRPFDGFEPAADVEARARLPPPTVTLRTALARYSSSSRHGLQVNTYGQSPTSKVGSSGSSTTLHSDDEGNGADPFAYLASVASCDGTIIQPQLPPVMPPLPFAGPSRPSGLAAPFITPSLPSPNGSVSDTGSTSATTNSPHPAWPMRPEHACAYVTFGAGMKQREVDMFTAAHPLPATSAAGTPSVVPYHVPFAAHPVGSTVMMTGGFGFLSRLHGLSLDNLVEVEMVLADGRIVIVSANSHPDLWWAVRGAGPAFGIATRYKAVAHPVPVVFAGNLIYRFRRATAPSLLRHYRDCIKGAPRELYANLLLTAGPADKDSLVVIQLCYVGPRERGAEFLQAISAWDGEPCLLNEIDEKSFLNQQDSVAQVLRGQRGRKWYIRSTLITSLPDEVIAKTVTQFANTPIGCTWLFELSGGALLDHEDTCIPHSQREAHFNVAALHQWDLHVDDPRCQVSAEEWIDQTLAPVSTGAPFTCFLGRGEPFQRVQSCFGEENFNKLAALKRKYDPNCLFKHTYWPLNASGETIEPALREPGSP